MPKSKGISARAAAGQRLKELRLRYGWKQSQIFEDGGQISAIESGNSTLDQAELVNAYTRAFRIDVNTLNDYRNGLISCDEFIVRAGVQPGDDETAGVPSKRSGRNGTAARLMPWEHDEVEQLLALVLVARGMPKLVAKVVVRSERLKLRDYPTWELRIAHMESAREVDDEDERRALPRKTSRSNTTRPAALKKR